MKYSDGGPATKQPPEALDSKRPLNTLSVLIACDLPERFAVVHVGLSKNAYAGQNTVYKTTSYHEPEASHLGDAYLWHEFRIISIRTFDRKV